MNELLELKKELQNIKSVNEIKNLMAHYQIMHNEKNWGLHYKDFACGQKDVSIQVGDSIEFIGEEKIKNLFGNIYQQDEEQYKGIMLAHYLTTPSIAVAKDGKTARGLWWVFGIQTVKEQSDIKPFGVWVFGSYANDFIKENEEWKIWHMRFSLVSKCTYKEGWVLTEGKIDERTPSANINNPLFNPYKTTYTQESIPIAPQPYITWNNEKWYLKDTDR